MHKKLESELVSLAHSILQIKNKNDVLVLKEKAGILYEKLSVLAFVDRFVEATPSASRTEVLEKIEAGQELEESAKTVEVALENKKETEVAKIEVIKTEPQEVSSEKDEAMEVLEEVITTDEKITATEQEKPLTEEKSELEPIVEDLFSIEKKEINPGSVNENTLEKELEGTIPLDVTTDLFENAIRVDTSKKSLNDVLSGQNLQIGLNDRIAFVKHLFDGSQEDFNRVLSQLNSFKNEKEAVKFITKMVKLDYDWSGKEEYEERFITLISRKFA